MTGHLSLAVWAHPTMSNPAGCYTKPKTGKRADKCTHGRDVLQNKTQKLRLSTNKNTVTPLCQARRVSKITNTACVSSFSDMEKHWTTPLIESNTSPVSKSSSYQTMLGATAALDSLRCTVLLLCAELVVAFLPAKNDLMGKWRKAINSWMPFAAWELL